MTMVSGGSSGGMAVPVSGPDAAARNSNTKMWTVADWQGDIRSNRVATSVEASWVDQVSITGKGVLTKMGVAGAIAKNFQAQLVIDGNVLHGIEGIFASTAYFLSIIGAPVAFNSSVILQTRQTVSGTGNINVAHNFYLTE